jgi:hypothetical protein
MRLKIIVFIGRRVVRPVYDFGHWLTKLYVKAYDSAYEDQRS